MALHKILYNCDLSDPKKTITRTYLCQVGRSGIRIYMESIDLRLEKGFPVCDPAVNSAIKAGDRVTASDLDCADVLLLYMWKISEETVCDKEESISSEA